MKQFDKYADLTGKRLTGEIMPEEQKDLSAWLENDGEHQSFSNDLEQVWKLSGKAAGEPFEADMESAWANIDSALGSGEAREAKVVPMRKYRKFWSVAAVVLALVAAGFWLMNQGPDTPVYVEVQTGDDEVREVILPDGSEVTLNENSLLSYAEDFAKRNVSLIGEAFFDVERMEESPFQITSGDATTTVLGTSFNVRAYPQEAEIEVAVKTGKVALAYNREKSAPLILEAGTAGVVKKAEAKMEKVEVENPNADAWKTMKLEFDDVLMRDVITTLERYFGTKIEVSNDLILECTYTSEFPNPDLDEILKVISFTIGTDYEPEAGGYRLSGEGCRPDN